MQKLIDDLLASLGDVPARELTALKTASIRDGGFRISGFVLCHPETHQRCIVEMSACRWLSNDESWALMHPDNVETQNTENQP